jgi:hypothetical protein
MKEPGAESEVYQDYLANHQPNAKRLIQLITEAGVSKDAPFAGCTGLLSIINLSILERLEQQRDYFNGQFEEAFRIILNVILKEAQIDMPYMINNDSISQLLVKAIDRSIEEGIDEEAKLQRMYYVACITAMQTCYMFATAQAGDITEDHIRNQVDLNSNFIEVAIIFLDVHYKVKDEISK